MMTKTAVRNREQMEFVCLDDLVPKNHPVRALEAAADWTSIYELVKDKYSAHSGRPSLDPVILVKLPLLQAVFGLPGLRQTLRETEVNEAYRWFLGLGLHEPVPHISTFRRNFQRCFRDTDSFERLFQSILAEYAVLTEKPRKSPARKRRKNAKERDGA